MADPRTTALDVDDDLAVVVDRALQRMRVLAAAVLVFHAVMSREGGVRSPLVLAGVSAGALLLLAVVARSAHRLRGTRSGWRLTALMQALEVVAAVAAVGFNRELDAVWVLLVVPVLSGALRYRLRGAFVSWLAVAALHLSWAVGAADTADLAFAGLLGEQVARVAVVLLVALPAGYLSEHLLIEVGGLARLSAAAEKRSALLEVVAESGQRLNDLDSQVFQAALDAARGLGFAAVDLWEQRADSWHRLSACPEEAGLPELAVHLGGGSAGTVLVLEHGAGDAADDAVLERSGWQAVVLVPVPGRRQPTVLRGAVVDGAQLDPSQVECLQLLGRQAGVALRNGELVADLQQAQQDLEHQAFHDDLTGIPNRALFSRRLEQVARAAEQDHAEFALLFCDLDRFKAVNDGLGHAVGNELLVAAVGRLKGCLRRDVVLARMGGDEFTLLLPRIDGVEEARAVADRVCKALTRPFAIAGHEVVISTSVGIAVGGRGCVDPGELMRRGDVAMYRSKARGRGRWTVWGEDLEEATASRLRLERDLRRAVDERQIEVVYQPVVAADGTVAGVEALARWTHPALGVVSPAEFISIAEESDLIVDLGRLVLQQALTTAARWLPRGGSGFVALNVSPRQLVWPHFADELERATRAAQLLPAQLLLEITERIVSTGAEAVAALDDLARRGFRLALDDFGQGQTSLQHLRHFPLTALKIDRGFVGEAVADERVRTILASIVDLGRALDLQVIAEGIESVEQAALLTELRCTYLQGYALAVPTPFEELPAAGSRAPGAAVAAIPAEA